MEFLIALGGIVLFCLICDGVDRRLDRAYHRSMTQRRKRPQAKKPRAGKVVKRTRQGAQPRGERYNRNKDK